MTGDGGEHPGNSMFQIDKISTGDNNKRYKPKDMQRKQNTRFMITEMKNRHADINTNIESNSR